MAEIDTPNGLELINVSTLSITPSRYVKDLRDEIEFKKGEIILANHELTNQKDANKILGHRLTNATDYSKKVEGWLHETARKANFTA
jgi:hypothetical protein